MTLDTLVFDGDCGFCTTSVAWLFRQVRPAGVEAVRYQSFDLDACHLTTDRAQYEVLWVPGPGTHAPVAGGAAAIARLLSASDLACWRMAGRLLSIAPISWIATRVYRVIARNRQRMPGGTDSCALRITGPD